MNLYTGDIRSGESWKTDTTPVRMRPYISAVSVSPNPVNVIGSLMIQVFVLDKPMPAYPDYRTGEIFAGEV